VTRQDPSENITPEREALFRLILRFAIYMSYTTQLEKKKKVSRLLIGG
jgi:hypothetical protein